MYLMHASSCISGKWDVSDPIISTAPPHSGQIQTKLLQQYNTVHVALCYTLNQYTALLIKPFMKKKRRENKSEKGFDRFKSDGKSNLHS